MQLREHFYSLLNVEALIEAAPGGILERESFEPTPTPRPFIVYAFATQLAEPRWHGPRRQNVRVYVHDDVGDYTRIDQTLDLVDTILLPAPSVNDGSLFMACEFFERSEDLKDTVMNTVYKFARYQLVTSG